MLTISFKLAKDQDHDDSILFDLICEDVPPGMEQDIEFEFSGSNLSLTPARIVLKDIFDPATRGAFSQIRAMLQATGEATATMNSFYKGSPLGSVQRSFDI